MGSGHPSPVLKQHGAANSSELANKGSHERHQSDRLERSSLEPRPAFQQDGEWKRGPAEAVYTDVNKGTQ
jgi:hypothetical protein